MEMKDIIEKVNYFSRLSKERNLNEEEKKEQEKYRKLYLEKFKIQVENHLKNIRVVDKKIN